MTKTFKNATVSIAILAAALLSSGSAIANQVKTAGSAVTLCKAEAQTAHVNYVSSKAKKIKEVRSGYKVRLKVITAENSSTDECEVSRKGEVSYTKA